jgi:hypothetical protein
MIRPRLADILENLERIEGYVARLDREAFGGDTLRRDAVERCLERICEAAFRLGVRTRNGDLRTLRSSVSLVEGRAKARHGRAKARHEKHRTSTTKQLVSGSSFRIKRAVIASPRARQLRTLHFGPQPIEFWGVFFLSKLSRKALTERWLVVDRRRSRRVRGGPK